MTKMVPNDEAVGGLVVSMEMWGPIIVQTEDGRTLEIRIEYGYDGAEHNVYDVTTTA